MGEARFQPKLTPKSAKSTAAGRLLQRLLTAHKKSLGKMALGTKICLVSEAAMIKLSIVGGLTLAALVTLGAQGAPGAQGALGAQGATSASGAPGAPRVFVFETNTRQRIRVLPIATGLVHPWSIAFLPDGNMLVAERAGRLRVIRNGTLDPQ